MSREEDPDARPGARVEPGTDEAAGSAAGASLIRHEEEPVVETTSKEVGAVRVRKGVESYTAAEVIPREIEHADVERVGAPEGDSGEIETLPDGSVSIPVFEERLVVKKEKFVRERIIVSKQTVTEEERVELELERERVQVYVDEGTREQELTRAIGREVRDVNGDKVGSLDLLFRDEETGRPAWIGVKSGLVRTRRFLVPLHGVEVSAEELRLPWQKELVEGAPTYDEEDERGLAAGGEQQIVISPEKEERLYAHYGVPPVRSVEEGGRVRFRAWRLGSERARE